MFSTGRDLESPSSEALRVFEDILRSARASQSVIRIRCCSAMRCMVTTVPRYGAGLVASRISMDLDLAGAEQF